MLQYLVAPGPHVALDTSLTDTQVEHSYRDDVWGDICSSYNFD